MDDIVNLIFGITSFVGYNFASLFVLSNVDPVLHGACNVLKRCLTVGLSILMIPQEALISPQQLFGVVFTFIALLGVYAHGRSRPNGGIKLARCALIAVVVSQQILTTHQSTTLSVLQTIHLDEHLFVGLDPQGCTSRPAPVCGGHVDCINLMSGCSSIPNALGLYQFVPNGYNFGKLQGKREKVHLWGTGHDVGNRYQQKYKTSWKKNSCTPTELLMILSKRMTLCWETRLSYCHTCSQSVNGRLFPHGQSASFHTTTTMLTSRGQILLVARSFLQNWTRPTFDSRIWTITKCWKIYLNASSFFPLTARGFRAPTAVPAPSLNASLSFPLAGRGFLAPTAVPAPSQDRQ